MTETKLAEMVASVLKRVRKHELNGAMFEVLIAVGQHSGQAVTLIAHAVDMSIEQTTNLLVTLERGGYVVKKKKPFDPALYVEWTEKGMNATRAFWKEV